MLINSKDVLCKYKTSLRKLNKKVSFLRDLRLTSEIFALNLKFITNTSSKVYSITEL